MVKMLDDDDDGDYDDDKSTKRVATEAQNKQVSLLKFKNKIV